MWEILAEWCADMFGETVRNRLGLLVLFCAGVFLAGVAMFVRWGPLGWLPVLLMVTVAVTAARQVPAARNSVWRAACLELDEPGQRPDAVRGQALPPTAAALVRLAEAVDGVRRGHYAEANEGVPHIRAELLRPEEAQLLSAVQAMISVGLGANDRAAQQAASALPTGSRDLDVFLGRTVLTEAWNDPVRLHAIHAAWRRAGIRQGPLLRLEGLLRVRIDAGALESLDPDEARELSDEARAIGDDDLAVELAARSRSTAYR